MEAEATHLHALRRRRHSGQCIGRALRIAVRNQVMGKLIKLGAYEDRRLR
jgi:hypothetical protein